MSRDFRLLVLTDVHYAPQNTDTPRPACLIGCELLRRSVEDAKRRGGFDAIALLGDLMSHPAQASGPAALAELRDALAAAAGETPLLVAPGNHDDPEAVFAAFGTRAGMCEIGGYRFVVFADRYDGDLCTRSRENMELLRRTAGEPGGPIVALQHNPIYPSIHEEYPYMPLNVQEILREYKACGVSLSLSGHYHAGQPLSFHEGVRYLTCPALADAPYSYSIVALNGPRVSVEQRRLRLNESPAVVDWHVHTEFAYCGKNIHSAAMIERAKSMGLAGLCLVEHAPQLYIPGDDFWAGRHVREKGFWRTSTASRMAAFRRDILPLRNDFVRIGLEVEIDADGGLTLRDEDRDVPDVLVGAVHWLHRDVKELSDAELVESFRRTTFALLDAGVDILAHPFRMFGRSRIELAKTLYAEVAQRLSDTRTAAEVNFHIQQPDDAFFAECVRRGVKIAFGSDSHELWEVGLLGAHMDLLRKVAGRDDVSSLLFT
jgi:histidinol phosphatase-like PHP family hydrolase